MEGKGGSGSGPRNVDHQSAAVNVSERKFSDDKRRVCSSAECKTFLGEADKNRCSADKKGSKISEKSNLLKPETTENQLQESYNNAFQKHVDNLTNVITQHRHGRQPDKPKTEVHIHTKENSKNTRIATPKPLSKLEIKSEAGVNQRITFAQEEDEDEEFEDFNKMKPLKAMKKVKEALEDDAFFEELEEPKPMITFNHVCTEAESDQISFNQIKSSRSSSPMLEVPSSKSCEKMASRPPL